MSRNRAPSLLKCTRAGATGGRHHPGGKLKPLKAPKKEKQDLDEVPNGHGRFCSQMRGLTTLTDRVKRAMAPRGRAGRP